MKLKKGWYRAFGHSLWYHLFLLLGSENMIDLHQDLLSILYQCYLRNDYSYAEEWIQNFREDNVSGLLANLYFMNPEEMKKEIGDREINVVEMFRVSTELFRKYLPNEKVVFSIEGCDYIKDTNELEELYKLGLRNILLVWNNPNRYGSGNRGDYGLTDEGREFLKKAIDLGISIDMSHMNPKTFYDTIDLIKEQKALGKQVKVIASHSNCYELCHHERNLTDDQLRALKSVDGVLGLVSFTGFTRDEDSKEDYEELYLKHIERAVSILGIDHVSVSSDDMTFCVRLYQEDYGPMIFPYGEICLKLRNLLLTKFSEEDVHKILYENIYNHLFGE